MIQYDTVIGNPPFSGSLHLDIIESILPFMSGRSTGCFIHPATWLINVRKNGKAKKYDELKKKLKGHIKSVVIENLNNDFGTGLYVPFSITDIDMSYTGPIKFTCCGEEKTVNSLYDCNLIGDYNTIWSILEKVQTFGDMMKNHIWDGEYIKNFYIAFSNICYTAVAINSSCGSTPDSLVRFTKTINGDFLNPYFYNAFHNGYEISDTPHKTFKRGYRAIERKDFTNKDAEQLCGTKQELENWKHFIFNNKLPLFLNIVLTIDQNNNSKEFLPWLVDKQYTDDEINTLFGFTDEEIKLMDDTLKKFERNSPWFKRYMCGKEDFINISG